MINLGQFSIFMEKNFENIFHDLLYFNANIFLREQIKIKILQNVSDPGWMDG